MIHIPGFFEEPPDDFLGDNAEDGLYTGYIDEGGCFVIVGPPLKVPRWYYMILWFERWKESFRLATWRN